MLNPISPFSAVGRRRRMMQGVTWGVTWGITRGVTWGVTRATLLGAVGLGVVAGAHSPTRAALIQYFEQQVIIRVQAREPLPPPDAPRHATIKWEERDGPKCVMMRSVVGVHTVQKKSIDLITRERQRLRANLKGDCRGTDFYSGFYMEQSADGQLCRDRDMLHSRTGAQCRVDDFTLMVPIPKPAPKAPRRRP